MKLLLSSVTTDKCFKTQWVMPRGPALEQGVKGKTVVVHSKFENLQRSVDNTTSVLSYNETDASKKEWGAFCQRISAKGEWTSEKKEMYINILEVQAVKLALMSFRKQMKMKAAHFHIGNTTALT